MPYVDETTGNYLQNLRFGYSALNPLYEREYLNNFSRSNYRTLQDNFAINFYATPHFTAKAWITLSQRSYESRVFVDPLSASNSAFATPQELGSLTVNGSDTFSYDANLLFMYNRNFNKHFLNFSLGGNAVETSYTVDNIKYIGFSTGALNSPNDAAQVEGKPTESKNKTRLVGMFLSGNYTYDDLPCEAVESSRLIVNASPVGTYPNVDAAPRIPYAYVTPEHYLLDLVYNPPLTQFLDYGRQRGAHILNGRTMFVGQAEASWRIWNA